MSYDHRLASNITNGPFLVNAAGASIITKIVILKSLVPFGLFSMFNGVRKSLKIIEMFKEERKAH